MAALPVVSGEQAVRAFRKAGWRKDRQRGGHVVLIKQGQSASLSVPQHRELAPGTLRSLLRAAGMTVSEFAAMVVIQMKTIAKTNVSPDKSILRRQLQAGYRANAVESLEIAGIWFPAEEEASQRLVEGLSISVGLVEL